MRKRYQLSTGHSFPLATVVDGEEQARGKRSITKEDRVVGRSLGRWVRYFFFQTFSKISKWWLTFWLHGSIIKELAWGILLFIEIMRHATHHQVHEMGKQGLLLGFSGALQRTHWGRPCTPLSPHKIAPFVRLIPILLPSPCPMTMSFSGGCFSSTFLKCFLTIFFLSASTTAHTTF